MDTKETVAAREFAQTNWRCSKCGYRITGGQPPEICPGCNERCEFLNITCYTPECGGPGGIDPRL